MSLRRLQVIVVGSHLDSVDAGPGINDNGSGSATNLQMLIEFARLYLSNEEARAKVKSRVRFCFWGAEEEGLLGSEAYVARLASDNPGELANIAVNMNFDMLGRWAIVAALVRAAGCLCLTPCDAFRLQWQP